MDTHCAGPHLATYKERYCPASTRSDGGTHPGLRFSMVFHTVLCGAAGELAGGAALVRGCSGGWIFTCLRFRAATFGGTTCCKTR